VEATAAGDMLQFDMEDYNCAEVTASLFGWGLLDFSTAPLEAVNRATSSAMSPMHARPTRDTSPSSGVGIGGLFHSAEGLGVFLSRSL